MGLLFRNALKGLKRKKIQMFGIILLITLSTGIYVSMNTALDRLENKYYDYLEEQNVENISGDVVLDYNHDVTIDDLNHLEETELKEMTEEERQLFSFYKSNIEAGNENIDVTLLTNIQYLFMKYEANVPLEMKKLGLLQDTYRFDFEYEKSKVVMDDDLILKVIPYNKDKKINKVYVREGRLPEKASEITMLEGFAKANDLEIGSSFTINEKEYKIVGFTYASDYVYPLITFSTPIFDEKKNNIIFMTQEDYKDVVGIPDNTYALRFRDNPPRKFEITMGEIEEEKEITVDENPMEALFQNEESTIVMGVNTVSRIARTGALQLEFVTNRLFADYFLYLLLTISVIIIMIVTKKRIEDERLQIGVLKSLGYSKYSIALSYLVYPILGSIVGGILGFSIGSILNEPMAHLFLSYYNVPLNNFTMDFSYLKDSIVTPLLLLSILSYIIALVMLRKKPLQLLKEGSNLKVNFVSKVVNIVTKPLPFKNRFKYSLASRSIGKLLIVTITSFATGMLIVLTLIGMNLFSGMIESSFEGMEYDYMAYTKNVYAGSLEEDDVILNVSLGLKEIQDKEGKKKESKNLEEDETITITGMDKDVKTIHLENEKKENMTHLLDESSIIVSKNMKEYLELELEDKLVFVSGDTTLTYTVVGFSNELMSFSGYVDREVLSHQLGYEEAMYNVIYSKNPKYKSLSKMSEEDLEKIAYVMSFTDLKENIMKQMDRFNTSIYMVIAFAAVMAFVIISVIASVIVEENKKTISLMKVMGYKKKEVSSIVLNIYTPFVMIAYLLSIPTMISLLKWIVAQLVGDMQITIPISISFTHALIGLIALLVAYYIAISLSKRALNKIPLAVALKRE